jgi:hypothetical protein
MHWTYKFESESDLEQGDILRPTEYLEKILTTYHPYYASHPDNQLFIVLSQSCDLACRKGDCKASYITLAPVRPLRAIIEREFQHQLRNCKPQAQAFGSNRTKSIFSEFLKKLFNNNNPHYFFLREQQDKQIAEDMCAITTLSISIKSEHYSECQKARILQLENIFQAKLGWLVGQKYSRVGTRDWDEIELDRRVNQVVSNTAVWVDDNQFEKVKREIKNIEVLEPKKIIDNESLSTIISRIPVKKKLAIDAIIKVLVAEKVLPEEDLHTSKVLQKKLNNDPTFSKFF